METNDNDESKMEKQTVCIRMHLYTHTDTYRKMIEETYFIIHIVFFSATTVFFLSLFLLTVLSLTWLLYYSKEFSHTYIMNDVLLSNNLSVIIQMFPFRFFRIVVVSCFHFNFSSFFKLVFLFYSISFFF